MTSQDALKLLADQSITRSFPSGASCFVNPNREPLPPARSIAQMFMLDCTASITCWEGSDSQPEAWLIEAALSSASVDRTLRDDS